MPQRLSRETRASHCARAGRGRFPTPGRYGFALALCVWAGAVMPAPSTPLSLDLALTEAEARSAALQGQQFASEAYRQRAVAAGRLPDPELGLSVSNLPVSGDDSYSLNRDFMTMRSLGLSQTWVGADKRRARSERLTREAQTAQATHALQQATLRTRTARAWLDRLYQERILKLLEVQREALAQVGQAAEAAYRSAGLELAEVFLARSAVARLDDRLREANTELANAVTRLARWVGEAATEPLGPLPDITHNRLTAHEEDLSTHIEQHPDLQLLAAREEVARAEMEVARQEKALDWNWSLMFSQRGPDFSDMVSVGVSIPLQWDRKNRQDREIAAALALSEQAQLESEEMRREHLAETEQLLANWRSRLERLADYDRSLIPLARERAQALETGFRGGKSGLPAVLEARRMVLDTELERLLLERETALLWADLEFLLSPAGDAASPALASSPP